MKHPAPVIVRRRTLGEKQPANLNLDPENVKTGKLLFRARYRASLSEVVDRLLDLEINHKSGLLTRAIHRKAL